MEVVDINLVKPNRYNPKVTEENKERYEAIKAGIEEFGMKTPIDVRVLEDGTYKIIDGFHRWKACRELGWTEIPISSWGTMDDLKAKKITILKEKARIPLDLIKTSGLLNELAKDTSLEDLARQTGYRIPELKDDLKLAGFNWDDFDKGEDKEKKEGVKTLSIIMSDSQYAVVQQAIGKSKEKGSTDSEARAIELICADYLSAN